MELRTSLEDEPITRPITMSTQPSQTVAAEGLSKVRAGDDEGLAAGGLTERRRRALQIAAMRLEIPPCVPFQRAGYVFSLGARAQGGWEGGRAHTRQHASARRGPPAPTERARQSACREATLGATALRSMGAHTMSYEHFADSARAQPHLLGVHLWSARSEQLRGQFSETGRGHWIGARHLR